MKMKTIACDVCGQNRTFGEAKTFEGVRWTGAASLASDGKPANEITERTDIQIVISTIPDRTLDFCEDCMYRLISYALEEYWS